MKFFTASRWLAGSRRMRFGWLVNFSTKIPGARSRNGSSVLVWRQWRFITRCIFALEAHQDEHPAFNRRAVGSIRIGRTTSFHEDVGKRSSRQTFNLEIAGSNPAVLTMCPVGPMDHDASLRHSKFRFKSGAGYQSLGASSSGQDGALSLPRRGFDSPRARQSLCSHCGEANQVKALL